MMRQGQGRVIALVLSSVFPVALAEDCGRIENSSTSRVLAYLKEHFQMESAASLTVLSDNKFQRTCYRQLTIGSPLWPTPLVFYFRQTGVS
jgi:hypothetical protein